MTQWVDGNAPKAAGWYAVMISGDSEYLEGHELYSYPDYQTFACWTPAAPDELEDWEDGYQGYWSCQHDEPPETIFAFLGPLDIPPYSAGAVK